MARRLRSRKLRPDFVLSSPAVRALTTASIMVRELKVAATRVRQDERLYLASPPDMLAVVRELGGDAQHLMLLGHNPGITEFANQLSAGETSSSRVISVRLRATTSCCRGPKRRQAGQRL